MDEELQRIRDRVHKIADELQEHRMKLGEHELRINAAVADIMDLKDAMATSEQLENVRAMLTVKLDNLTDTVGPIKRGINWAVGLILSGVILALLNLVLRGNRP